MYARMPSAVLTIVVLKDFLAFDSGPEPVPVLVLLAAVLPS
jgi:hypothetical protein